MEVSSLLIEVEKKYSSLRSYEDHITVKSDRSGYRMDSSFTTKYLSPDKLVFRSLNLDSKDESLDKVLNIMPNFDSYIDGRRGRVEMDERFAKKIPSIPFIKSEVDWNDLDRTHVLAATGGITNGASNYTLPLLIKGTKVPNWTKHKDFRSMGKKKLDGESCHVIRRVSHPVMIWISAKDFTVRRVEHGAEILDQAMHSVTSLIGRISNPIWEADSEFFKNMENASLETVATFDSVKLNNLESNDLKFH